MARELGSIRRGEDGDEGNAGLTNKVVEIENAYFDRLKARLNAAKPTPGLGLAGDGQEGTAVIEPTGPGFVVYGADGRPVK